MRGPFVQDEKGEWTKIGADTNPIGGGAMSLGSVSTAKISGSTFKNNVSGYNGGAIGTRLAQGDKGEGSLNDNSAATLDLSADFEGNVAYNHGGALYNSFYKSVNVAGHFTANEAKKDGGAIYNDAHADKLGNGAVMNVATSSFNANKAQNGGALYNSGKVSLKDSSFEANQAQVKGGAIYNSGELTLSGNNVFTGNSANGLGNDIYNTGSLILTAGSVTMLHSGLISESAAKPVVMALAAEPVDTATVQLQKGATLGLGGTSVVEELTGSEAATLHIMSTDVKVTQNNHTALDLTASGDVNDQLGGDVTKLREQVGGQAAQSVTMQEGLVRGEVTQATADAAVVVKNNTVMEATQDIATSAVLSMNRILMNDVRKRMGDLRAGEATSGVWARYDGGRLSGEQVKNDFNTIQIGIDTVPEAGAPRMGTALSFTKGDGDFARGSADMQAFALAAYGTWFADNGVFVDVIGRFAKNKTDLTVGTNEGHMDNVALSLSGELGWRLDVTDLAYIEPQAELTYTYVDGDQFALNSDVTYKVNSTDSLLARAGFAAGLKCPANKGDIYVRVSAVHEFLGDMDMSATRVGGLTNTMPTKDGKDTWVEYGIGGQWNINDATYVWADAERTSGATMDEDWRATVGVRYNF